MTPEAAGERGDALRPDVEGQLGVDGVVGAERRPLDRRPAAVARVVGLDAPPAAGAVVAVALLLRLVLERRRDVERVVRIEPALDRRGEDERLEGRAGLPPSLREQVELVVRAAGHDRGHRADRPVPGVDRDHRRCRVGPPRERRADRLLGEPLPARLDRRVDLEAARANGLGAVLLDELVRARSRRSRARGSGRRAAPDAAAATRCRRAPAYWRRVIIPSSSIAQQDLVPPRDRAGGVDERVVGRRRLVEPGEQRRLREGQPAGRPGEVRARGRLGAVGQVPVEDGVEVRGEDPLLRPRAVELHREAGLGHLPLDRALVRDVEVADELLA